MCLVLLSHLQHPKYKLILASNRDEFFSRPTSPLHFWPGQAQVLAGRDEVARGTWLGINRYGKIGVLTNYRAAFSQKRAALSRGLIVSQFLETPSTPTDYGQRLRQDRAAYQGFSFIFGRGSELFYYSSVSNELKSLDPGIYGLSNAMLDQAWPKLAKAKRLFRDALEQSDESSLQNKILALLRDDEQVTEPDTLPDTGVGLEKEKMLSSIFIRSPQGVGYGTRSSSVLLLSIEGEVSFLEQTYGKNAEPELRREMRFQVPGAPS